MTGWEYLNSLLALDRGAVESLVRERHVCNDALADSPHVQVQDIGMGLGCRVSALGLLNGLLHAQGQPMAVAVYDEGNGRLLRFEEHRGEDSDGA